MRPNRLILAAALAFALAFPAPAPALDEAQGDIFQAEAMLISRQYQGAYDHYRLLYAEFPTTDRIVDGYVRTLAPMHKWDELRPLVLQERERRHAALLYGRELAAALRAQGFPEQALEENLLWWIGRPDDRAAAAVSDTILLETNYSEAAMATVKRVSRQAPKFFDLRRLYIRVLAVSGRGAAAREEAAQLDRENRAQGRNLMELANGLSEEHPMDAVLAAEALVKEFPSSPLADEARLARGRWLRGTSRWSEAKSELQELARRHPTEGVGVKAMLLLAEGDIPADPAAARTNAQNIAQRFPEALGASNRVVGLSYQYEGRFGDAARAFMLEARGQADPAARRYALWNTAESYFFATEWDSAGKVYKMVALKYVNDPLGHEALERMLLLADAEEDGDALKSYAAASALALRDPARADTALQAVHTRFPNKISGMEALFQVAALRQKKGDVAEALRLYGQVADSAAQAPRAPEALYQSAEIQRTRLAQPRRAMELYSEVVTRFPDSWRAPDARKWMEKLRREVGS